MQNINFKAYSFSFVNPQHARTNARRILEHDEYVFVHVGYQRRGTDACQRRRVVHDAQHFDEPFEQVLGRGRGGELGVNLSQKQK